MNVVFYILLAIQTICCSLALFGDIGFDKPGKYGMDYSALVVIGWVYAIALISGLVVGFMKKLWLVSMSQFLPIVYVLGYIYLPYPSFSASKYQDLVGKPKAEVVRRIGHPRGMVTGAEWSDRGKNVEFINVRCMVIYISSNGVVLSVESQN